LNSIDLVQKILKDYTTLTNSCKSIERLQMGVVINRTSDVDTRRSLRSRSSSSTSVVVPVTRRSTIGDRAFPVAAARAWNRVTVVCHVSVITVDFQATFKDVLVCCVMLMVLTSVPLSMFLFTDHVVVFLCYVSLKFSD